MSEPLVLHPDRAFDPEPTVRRIARDLYDRTASLPLICPHGHVDPALLAEDTPFPEPAALLVQPDHYILRMLHSQGVSLASMGVPSRTGAQVETNPRAVWRRFAERYHLFLGTPTRFWMDHVLVDLFGVQEVPDASSADRLYDQIAERLQSPEFRPRALFARFNIEVLATTDAATDPLVHHQRLRADGWGQRVIPTFRPDALFRLAHPDWRTSVAALAQVTGRSIGSYAELVDALADRRAYFQELGAVATDHAVVEPVTGWLPVGEAERLFQVGLTGAATADDQRGFEAHLLMEMAAMSTRDGLVMQLHPGSLRDHNVEQLAAHGPDRGADMPVATEYTRNLRPLLNAFGSHPEFTLILFTLDESTYARELAPLAGHYPALRLGPPWWFHDSIEGMRRFRERTTETAGFWNTAGFNDDTRAFCSIPARHDLARRMDANWLASLVSRHLISMADARRLATALAYDLAVSSYRLHQAPPEHAPPDHAPPEHAP